MAILTREDNQKDLQTKLDQQLDRITQRLATKQEVQTMCNQLRNRSVVAFNELFQQQQVVIRQMMWQIDQVTRRMQALENRLLATEGMMKVISQNMDRISYVQAQQLKAHQDAPIARVVPLAPQRPEPMPHQAHSQQQIAQPQSQPQYNGMPV